ncbi:class III lanthionine synthetase LanKC [Microbacterium sp. cf332]|uniref:class III lanthionine synthetase LanKC n=1 Tax=Microbacterium sp. cf332 TaxID=1761804 RepID=UPI00088847E5|nr:class III lanthionine synthetase LanKC [Microbacterium sp. cf332]SDQ56274.1 Protein kinase domain-containing protein [Microbacterium sp. cf332]
MDDIHLRYTTADPLFYDEPHVDSGAPTFAVADAAGWSRSDDAVWIHHHRAGTSLPEQGWKIHVSTIPAEAQAVLDAVAHFCRVTGTAFKHLRDASQLDRVLSKEAERASSGKFITIYPPNDEAAHSALLALDAEIGGRPGPYILSDLRWRRGPLYVRYGAFRRQLISHEGVDTLAVRDLATGRLVPDVRTHAFRVPAWVTIPPYLVAEHEALTLPAPAGFPAVTRALHHSNAGGVYEAVMDGRPVVLKEARPHAGFTADGRDAVARLRDEASVLRKLSGLPVPRVLATFSGFGHEFVALERVDGIPLSEALVARHPLIRDGGRAAREEYRTWALGVGRAVRAALDALHARGRTHGDLHPRNVLVDDGGAVTLIDFEASATVGDDAPAWIGAPGFVPRTHRDAVARDRYALACIELFLFVPLTTLIGLGPDKARDLLDAARTDFDLDGPWVADRLAVISHTTPEDGAGEAAKRARHGAAGEGRRIDATAVVAALRVDATPQREDRLWPGDPRQFAQPAYGLAHGALGVLAAMGEAGERPNGDHRRWVAGALRRASFRPGLMDGVAGAVWGLRRLGEDAAADLFLSQLRRTEKEHLPSDLATGLAGIGIGLVSEMDRAPSVIDDAASIARILAARLMADEPRTSVPTGRGGLLAGATGTALFALRLYERTGDAAHLALARRAIDHDIVSLTDTGDGALQIDEGWRSMPYLAHGSAGIGAVLVQLARHLPGDDRHGATLDGIARAAAVPFVVQGGLYAGRSGLIAFLALLEAAGHGSPELRAARDAHVRALRLHAIHRDDGTRFAGDGNLRASCDLATGSAGVLVALESHRAASAGEPVGFAGIPLLTAPGSDAVSIPARPPSARGGE